MKYIIIYNLSGSFHFTSPIIVFSLIFTYEKLLTFNSSMNTFKKSNEILISNVYLYVYLYIILCTIRLHMTFRTLSIRPTSTVSRSQYVIIQFSFSPPPSSHFQVNNVHTKFSLILVECTLYKFS